jgi:sialate O-acetylesterase
MRNPGGARSFPRALAATAALLALGGRAASAQTIGVSFPFNYTNTLSDHAVLQRAPQAATVWGFGTQFAPVSLTLVANASAPVTVSGWVSSTGVWRLTLPPTAAGGGRYEIVGNSTQTGESFVLRDIVFGDVFVCGGQSNMAFGLSGISNATAEIAAAAGRPGMRIMSMAYSAQNVSQLQLVWEYALTQQWQPATPDNVRYFSAVCYLSAAHAYDALGGGVPMGLIDTSVGGTAVQLWLSPERWNDCAAVMQSYDVFSPPWTPSCWYNGMVAPLTYGPTQVAAFIFDQGENNVGEREMYECTFPLLINAWRDAFRAPDAPFIFVQLPAYVRQNDTQLAELREGQLAGADRVANVGFACTADAGDAYFGCIHNRDKSLVGRRTGALVRAMLYGEEGVPHLSPRYASATATAAGGTVTVTVVVGPPAALAGGLVWVPPSFASNSSWCPHDADRQVNASSCGWFEIATSDGVWRNATASVSADGSAVVLSVGDLDASLTAVATRNGYADWPVVNVYNGAGLPLVPWTPRNVSSG